MRSIATDVVHLLFTLPFLVLVLLLAACVSAWWRGAGSPLHRWRHVLAGLALGVAAISMPAVPNLFVTHIEAAHAMPSEAELQAVVQRGDVTIVVLTGGWFRRTDDGYEVMMGGNSWERTWSAVQLWRRIGGTLIFSGAPLPDESDSVAEHMAEVARRMGVPAAQVRVETLSRNTHENLLFTKSTQGLRAEHPVVLVSSALNLPRATAIAHKLGLSVLPYPCDYRGDRHTSWRSWLPSNDAPGALEEALHEWVGLMWYRLRGWA